MNLILIVLLCFVEGFAKNLISNDEIGTLINKFVTSKITQDEKLMLNQVIEVIRLPNYVSRTGLEPYKSYERMNLECLVCRSAFSALIDDIHAGQTEEEISSVIISLCVLLGIESRIVCDGAVRLNMPIIIYIVERNPDAKPETFCGLLMQSIHPDSCPFVDERFEWEVELPLQITETTTPATDSAPLKIAVITDAHIEPLYQPNGVANCGEPSCCRVGQTAETDARYRPSFDDTIIRRSVAKDDNGNLMLDLDVAEEAAISRKSSERTLHSRNVRHAGYWGDYNCGSPIWAYDEVIERMATVHQDIDIVYYVGDTIDHGVWATSYEKINEANTYAINKLRREFGDNIPVLPVIGNHESQPTNQFAPSRVTEEGLETHWLYDALAEKWSHYLTVEAMETLKKGGYYSMLVKPGLRVIVLNTNIAYKYNWWLVYDPVDAKSHLQWMVDRLYEAELAGERVHILSHIPPGVHDLTKTWTREYNRIINRFSSIISTEFNGHTHSDEFKIFYNSTGSPINVAWGAGSTATYTNYNVNYKIVTVDGSTYEPLEMESYMYNMTEANLTPQSKPHWFLLYNLRNTYGLSDMSATSVDDLVHRMVTTNKNLLEIYAAFFSKVSNNRLGGCGDDCLLDRICKTVVTELWERQKCEEISQLYRQYNN